MADLDQTQSAQPIYVTGADSSGLEQTPVQSTSAGALHSNLRDSGGNEITTHSAGSSRGLDVSIIDGSGNQVTTFSGFNKDFFGNGVISQIYNKIEVPFDDVAWANFVTETTVNGGSGAQANGQVDFQTGTNPNGRYAAISKDAVKYNPNAEIGFGFTWKFGTASISGVTLRVGATDDITTWANSLYFSHTDGIFSLVYNRGGSNIFNVQQSSWLDKCDGTAGSNYKNMSGSAVALDSTKDQLARIHCGLFGHAGFTVELLAPNQQWVTIYKYSNINSATVPIFTNFDLSVGAEVKKVSAGASSYSLSSACWAGWTGSPYQRAAVVPTDRSLVGFTKSIITGKSSSGGGTYIDVKVNPSGSLTTAIGDITGVVGQNTMANSLPVTIASNQTAIPISGTITANLGTIDGAATETTLSALNTKVTTTANGVKVDGSAVTQPISAASLPLPSGAATSAKQPDFGIAGTPSVDVVSVQGVTNGTLIGTQINAAIQSGYSPDQSSYDTGMTTTPILDASGRLETHSTVTTDEGSYRDDFVGSSLTTALTGTLSFTNGGLTVTGSGTLFTTEISVGDYIKKSADSETFYVEVDSVQSDTSLTLVSAYQGTTASASSIKSKWMTSTGSGATISVGSSLGSIASGTTSGATTYIQRSGDYLPYTSQFYFAVSQRIANQTLRVGFMDSFASPSVGAYVEFTGTTATQATFVSRAGASASDAQSTTFTLPKAAVTSDYNTYKIDVSGSTCSLFVNGVVVVSHQIHIPTPYQVLNIIAGVTNAATVTSTTLNLDVIYFYNSNRTQIDNDFLNEPINVSVSGFTPSVTFDAKEKDAFDRLITVTPLQLKSFDARITKHLDNFDEVVVGSGTSTLNTTTVTVDLATTTGATDSVIRQSYESFQYVRGNTQAGLFSLNLNGGPKTNNTRLFGLGDSENGAFIGIDGTGFFVMRRSKTSGSVVDTKTYQTSFNKDKLNGTGTSGITLDFTKQNLFTISYSWLGTNAIIYSATIAGVKYIMHVDSVGNSLTTAWCQSGQLPLYFENTNTGTTASSTTFKTGCAAVFSYGSSKGYEEYVSVSSVVTPITLSTAEKVCAGIRLRPGLKYVTIEPADYQIMPQSGNGFAYYKVIFRPTLTGATWTNYGEISQALTNNPTYTGGTIIQEGYLNLAAAGRLAVEIPATLETTLGYSINGTPDSLIIVVRTDAGTGGIYFAGSWKEIF